MGFVWFLYGEVFNSSFLYVIKIWGILYSSLREVEEWMVKCLIVK